MQGIQKMNNDNNNFMNKFESARAQEKEQKKNNNNKLLLLVYVIGINLYCLCLKELWICITYIKYARI